MRLSSLILAAGPALIHAAAVAKNSTASSTTTVAKNGTASSTSSGVVGTAYGFAKGTTGGGSAKPAAPKDIAELKLWLADSTPRVILIDKLFNFKGTEGSVKETGCRDFRPGTKCTAANGGQDFIRVKQCDAGWKSVPVTYDKAGVDALEIKSNKSIVGVGNKGVIQGKGLHIAQGSSNIIIQNVHITDLNPQYVWGGDALSIEGATNVWVDHCKFSKAGRMFIVSHFKGNTVTVSNNEFDGVTPGSATCNKNAYWGLMFIAPGEKITLDKNYFHDMSGRSPKINGQGSLLHATNNFFSNNLGHNFEISTETFALLEGNSWVKTTEPIQAGSGPTFADGGAACTSSLGRACVGNEATGSGALPKLGSTVALAAFAKVKANLVAPTAVANTQASVMKSAGVGKI
ncbi:hypothetical protein FKW77_001723 [Venturia effusa]|uniref:pectin lyase n=1 Tax=Venturia effusa TaxID=50376 RepID=A0A517LPL1_9PEZI|nr:hypothetical protein FKW77_001723 [Venturia effusa]